VFDERVGSVERPKLSTGTLGPKRLGGVDHLGSDGILFCRDFQQQHGES
jgi:hypothetical protein